MANPNIKITKSEIISDRKYTFKRVTFDYKAQDGKWHSQTREIFDRGNGACVFLYNKETKNIILTSQFRLPTYLNGNETGILTEVCAGTIEDEDPKNCILREIEEETGYRIPSVTKIFEAYVSPAAVTEIIYFFVAEYTPT